MLADGYHRRTMRFKIAVATALASTVVVAVPASSMAIPGPLAGTSATKTIQVKDNFFSPRSITVKRGTTLRFVWRGRGVHNVALGRRVLISNRRSGSGAVRVSKSVTLICTIHSGQKLAVRVR
jgi:plastocyanin